MHSKLMRSVVAGVACALAVAACGGTSSSGSATSATGGKPTRGGTLTLARSADILGLDPTVVTDNESIWTLETIFETLYVATPDGKHLRPWLATGYSLSPNHLTWTFHLRHGVRFQNGKPMTASDVKFSIQRVSAKASNPFAFIDAQIKSIQTPDPYTVVITTKAPWAPLLADMALFANSIIPANYGGTSEKQFFQHPIGTGPFSLQSWQKGNRIVLLRNRYYWQTGKPYLDQVVLTDVPNDNTRTLQLRGGQADIEEFPPFSSLAQLGRTSGFQVKPFPSSRTDFLEFNTSHAPFADVHVRRAIAFALNRQQMVKTVLFGYGSVANSFLSPALWAHDPSVSVPNYDLAQAKAELAKSSVPHGFSTTLQLGSGVSNEESLGALVQSDLAPLGIKVTLKPVDPNSEYTNIENGQYDMGFNYDTTDIIDPDELVTFSAMGGNTGQKTHTFFTNYNNPQIDKWGQEAEGNFDQSARQALYNKIQVQMSNDVPLIPLYYSPFAYASSSRVNGLQIYPTGNYHLENVWLSH